MDNHIHNIRSSVSTCLMRKALFRGTLLAGIGGGIILFSGISIPEGTLRIWGMPLFLAGLGLIAFGLLPYRRLNRLEKKPHELAVTENQGLQFSFRGKKTLAIPLESIEKTNYMETLDEYGIGISLKKPLPKKIVLYDPVFNLNKFEKESKKYGCDLFLPYFSKRSYLNSGLDDIMHLD